jgi:hypothetical protein
MGGLSGARKRWVNVRKQLVSKGRSPSAGWGEEGNEGKKEVQGHRSAGHVQRMLTVTPLLAIRRPPAREVWGNTTETHHAARIKRKWRFEEANIGLAPGQPSLVIAKDKTGPHIVSCHGHTQHKTCHPDPI